MLHLTSCPTPDPAEVHAHRVVAAEELVAELVAALRDLLTTIVNPAPLALDRQAAIVAAHVALARAEGAAP